MAKKPTSRTKTAKTKKKTGRPTLYKPEYAEQAHKLCLLSATDKELAAFFKVAEDSIHEWKKVHPEFSESITRGKMVADANVAKRLYERAMGYSHAEDKIFNNNGVALVVPTTKHYPPDTAACIFWLKNRQRDRWRDKLDHEHTGKDGKDLSFTITFVKPDGG